MKLTVAATLAALLIGLIGGLLGFETLFQVAQGVFIVGVAILCVWALWRRREVIVALDDEVGGEEPPLNIRAAEEELRRKDRGTVPASE